MSEIILPLFLVILELETHCITSASAAAFPGMVWTGTFAFMLCLLAI